MNAKKLLLATLAGFVGSSIAYFIVEEIIFKSYMASKIYEPTSASTEAFILPLLAVFGYELHYGIYLSQRL